MIKVLLTGPSIKGQFPYRAVRDGGEALLDGLSIAPLLDTCRRLKRTGRADAGEWVYLYRVGRPYWDARCTIGWGASHEITQAGFRRKASE